MDRKIKDITDRMIRRLPGGRSRYPLEELHGLDFPSFLIDRISVELQRNLLATLDPPQTEWSRMDAEEVQVKWREFTEAAGKAACLPAGEIRAVIGRAVEECLKILVRPRHQIPSLLFGSGDELPYGEVVQRLESTVVYTHFARLIPRYMQKKELRTLSRNRCEQIIRASDARMTENYGPEDWATLLQPLFELMKGSVDADLIRRFYEDKEMSAEAAQFAAIDGTVNRPMLIRVLSGSGEKKTADAGEWSRSLEERWPAGESPETPDPEQMAERETELHSEETKSAERPPESRVKQKPAPAGENAPSGDPPVSAESQEQTAEQESEPSSGKEDPADQPPGNEPENIPIWMRFMSPEEREELRQAEREEAEGEMAAERESEPSEADLLFGIAEEPPPKPEESRPRTPAPEEPRPPSAASGNGPQKGVEREHSRPEKGGKPASRKSVSRKPSEEIAETDPEPDHRKELKALQRVMRDEREAFVSAVFGDSEEAYREALEDISRMEDWGSVSRYMQQNVFQQNLVEMYSEAAVEFTDRLQAFFLKKQHSN